MTGTNHAIVACARGWIGTRFHHQGRIKKGATHKGGVDCLGLLIGVAHELELRDTSGQLLSGADERDYSHQPDNVKLKAQLGRLMRPVAMQDIAPGNILLLRIDGSPQHLAIVSSLNGQLAMIHAYAPARAVVEHLMSSSWLALVEAAYQL